MLKVFNAFRNDESGQDLIEYALVASLIALAAVAAMTGVGTKIQSIYASISGSFPT
jgi:pilus assembly protein Flp/PilA